MFRINTSLAVAALALSAPAALAGGYTAPVVEPVVVAPVVETAPGAWEGAYVGGTLGYVFKGPDRVGIADPATGANTAIGEFDLKGVTYGLRLGYGIQRGNWVFGPELSFEGGKAKDDFSNADGSASTKIKHVIALRGKLGYLVSPDTMVYGMAGPASAKISEYNVDSTGSGPAGAPVTLIEDSFTRSGYVVGLGVEHRFNENWSLTGEYEYANFGKRVLYDAAEVYSTRATPKYHQVRLGVNYRF